MAILLAGKLISLLGVLLFRGDLPIPMDARAIRTTLCVLIDGRCLMSGMADSWWPMWRAIEVWTHHAGDIYEQTIFTRGIKFQYPLSSLLPLLPFSDFAEQRVYYYLNLGNFFVWIAALGLAGRLGMEGPWRGHLAYWVLVTAVAALFGPLSQAFALGQVQLCIACLCIGAVLAWQAGRTGLAGVLIGLCCAFKPQLGIVLLWAALRGNRSFAVGMIITVALTQLASVLVFGFGQYARYLAVLRYLGAHGEPFYSNHSLFGVLLRAWGIGGNLEFDPGGFETPPAWMPIVSTATSLAMIALLMWDAWRRRMAAATPMDLAAVLVVSTIASPIAWDHHFSVVLPLLLLTRQFIGQRPTAGLVLALGASWFLLGTDLTLFNLLHASAWNILQAWMLWCALLLLTIYAKARGPAAVPAPSDAVNAA